MNRKIIDKKDVVAKLIDWATIGDEFAIRGDEVDIGYSISVAQLKIQGMILTELVKINKRLEK